LTPADADFAIPAATAAEFPRPVSALRRTRAKGAVRGRAALLGPAFVAAVAYVDPGNFATNFQGGARFGYLLVWVIVMANLMAMLVQYLSAKAGMVTGQNLPELCRAAFPRAASRGLWVQAEVIAMSTDLAEFVGAALGLNLLFGVPLFGAGLITAVVAFVILALEQRGYRRFELAIIALIALVGLGFVYDFLAVGHHSASGFAHGLVPGFNGAESVVLAVGIIGATVMPHVVYLHSALTQSRIEPETDDERRQLLRFIRLDCGLGLGLAGVINLLMLCIAAALFFRTGHTGIHTIGGVHSGLGSAVGGGAALAFAVALLASGLSSSSVGTYAGQVVMQGFIDRKIPLFARRAITMTPALIVLALGLSADSALVLSQVVLSFGIPFALIPLILVTRRRDIMGDFVNHPATTAVASVIAAIIVSLNVFLLGQTFFG
jgi:manganese transport protein